MINKRVVNDHKVVSFEGIDKITALNAEAVKKDLNNEFAEPNTQLIIDLENIEFIDSTGFGAFLSVMKTAHSNNGDLKICNINQEIMKLFKLLHLDNVFELHTDFNDCF